MDNIGSTRPPSAIPINITASEILSPVESRNDPLFDIRFVALATLPSTISRKPPSKIRLLPKIGI